MGKIKLENAWVERKTAVLKRQEGEEKTGAVARQQWTAPFGDTSTEKTWAQIGEAVRGRLPYNDPIEIKIRACKSADSALVADLKEQIVHMETRVEEAEAAKSKAIIEFEEFKAKYFNEQCTDAHYRINFDKTIKSNKRYIEQAKQDSETMKGLISQVQMSNQHVALLEAKLTDEDLNLNVGVESIKRPRVFEPKLTGSNESLEDEELLIMYEKAIEVWLDDMEAVEKKSDSDITIVFHDFNLDIKVFVAEGKIPFRSARMDNIIFACHGASADIRMLIYRRIAALSASTPRVVVVSGKGRVQHLPVKERKGVDNHRWFVSQVRTGAFRARPVNGLNEGYDMVIYRRLDDGK